MLALPFNPPETSQHRSNRHWTHGPLRKLRRRYRRCFESVTYDSDLLLVYVVGGEIESPVHVPQTGRWAVDVHKGLVGGGGVYCLDFCGRCD